MLLELTTEYMEAAEGLIDCLRAGVPVPTTGRVDLDLKRRVTRYTQARNALDRYAREREAMLS